MPKRRGKLLLVGRIGAAAILFLLFHVALLSSLPSAEALLLRLARLQFLPALFARVGAAAGWLVLGLLPVILLSLIAGRLYCSTLCPLGISQDIIIFLSGKLRRAGFRRASLSPRLRRTIHLGIAGLSVGLFFAGFTLLVNLLEPYAFWGRMERDLVLPVASGLSILSSQLLKSFDIFLSPIPFFGHIPVVVVTGLLFLLLCAATLLKGRWYCSYLCPTGAILRLLNMIPKAPLLRVRSEEESCTLCGLCEKVCKAGAISVDKSGVRIERDSCVVCFVCISRCPYGALSFGPGIVVSSPHEKYGSGGRRRFFKKTWRGLVTSIGGGSLAAVVLPGSYGALFSLRGRGPEGKPNRPATPPGSRGIGHFTRSCISCHSCVSVCPTHVLQPSLFEYGPTGFMQPVMDYSTGYCEWECSSCLKVCPSGAIRPLRIEEKQRTQIGRVQFIQDRCVVFSKGTACGACAEVCPTGAVWMVPYREGLTQPKTDNDICVGCGNCEYACPVEGGKAIFVRGNEVHTERELRKGKSPGAEAAKPAEPEEFPF